MNLPSVAVVGYNRPLHLKATLASLAACERFDEVSVTIFLDGAASVAPTAGVLEVREVAASFARAYGARVVLADTNRGLARSVVSAVDTLLEATDRVIVIEDDLILHGKFLRFLIEALDRYADDERVFQVSGFMYPLQPPRGRDVLVLPQVTSWGWGTWARAWRHMDPNPILALDELRDSGVRYQFDLRGSYPYSQMLLDRFEGRNASWMILWNWACFAHGGVVIYPSRSLVGNMGFDGSGVHCTAQAAWFVGTLDASNTLPASIQWPRAEVDDEALECVVRFMRTAGGQALLRNRLRRLARLATGWLAGRG